MKRKLYGFIGPLPSSSKAQYLGNDIFEIRLSKIVIFVNMLLTDMFKIDNEIVIYERINSFIVERLNQLVRGKNGSDTTFIFQLIIFTITYKILELIPFFP